MSEPTGSMLVGVLDLLLTRAHKLVVVGMVVFFIGPTVLAGFLIWRTVDRQDRQATAMMTTLNEHAIAAREAQTAIQTALLTFIATQHAIEEQRNELLFEICMTIGNDGPARARCRAAIGR